MLKLRILMIRSILLIFFALTALFFSFGCKKDSTTATAVDLVGTWKLANIKVNGKTTTVVNDAGSVTTTIGTYGYTTVKNGGVLTFSDATNFKGVGLTYATPDTSQVYASTYQDGVFYGNYAIPSTFSLGPFNESGTYKVIGSDSLYCSGGVFNLSDGSHSITPSGAKFTIAGNILTYTSIVNQDQILNSGQVKAIISLTGVVTLQKQ